MPSCSILLISATKPEAELFLRHVFHAERPVWKSDTLVEFTTVDTEEDPIHWIVTGMGPKNAYEGVRSALESRPTVKIGIGLGFCAGLNKTLHPGEVILPVEVSSPGKKSEGVTPALRRALLGTSKLEERSLMTEEKVVFRAAEKTAIFAATGIDALDMESHGWLEALREKGVERAVIRSILDPASLDVPEEFSSFVDVRGNVSYGRLLRSVLAHPSILSQLWSYRPSVLAARAAAQVDLLGDWLESLGDRKAGDSDRKSVV